MITWIKDLITPPSPERLAEEQYVHARREYLGALAEKEWAEARCACLKARIERLEDTPREEPTLNVQIKWAEIPTEVSMQPPDTGRMFRPTPEA